MKTTKYALKSNFMRTEEVSAECAEKAEEMLELALQSKRPKDLVQKINSHPYFKNSPDLANVMLYLVDEMYNKPGPDRKLKLEDEIYLRTCMYGTMQLAEDAMVNSNSLMKTVGSLIPK